MFKYKGMVATTCLDATMAQFNVKALGDLARTLIGVDVCPSGEKHHMLGKVIDAEITGHIRGVAKIGEPAKLFIIVETEAPLMLPEPHFFTPAYKVNHFQMVGDVRVDARVRGVRVDLTNSPVDKCLTPVELVK